MSVFVRPRVTETGKDLDMLMIKTEMMEQNNSTLSMN